MEQKKIKNEMFNFQTDTKTVGFIIYQAWSL